MKRFRRWLFNGLAAVSLIVFLATVALWVHSIWAIDAVYFCGRPNPGWLHVTQLWASRGRLRLDSAEAISLHPMPGRFELGYHIASNPPFNVDWVQPHDLFGFGQWNSVHNVPFYAEHKSSWVAPLWFLCGVTAIPPAIWVMMRLRQRRRRNLGLCLTCGYDLRATPTAARNAERCRRAA